MHLLREWTTAYVNSLPDSSFAYVNGKVRKLPYKDADGKVDIAHVRNALARLSQTQGISAEEKSKIKAKLEKLLGEKLDDDSGSEELGYMTLLDSTNVGRVSNIEILRVGTIQDRGLKITREMLDQYVANFYSNIVGDVDEYGKPELPINLEHKIGSAAAGWIKKLYVDESNGEERLMAEAHWTELGQENIAKKLFKYTSSELNAKYPHHKTGELFKNVLSGLALTNSPALKSQRPLVLSVAVDKLFNSISMFEKMLAKLAAQAVVSKQEKDLLKTCLAELPADEQEANKEAVAGVGAKPEAPEKTEAEKAAEVEAATKAEAEAKAKADAEAAAGTATLAAKHATEKLEAATKEVEKLKADLAKVEAEKLTTVLTTEAETLMVSPTRLTGFVGDGVKEKITKFTSSLTQTQRGEFVALMSLVKTVTLKEVGSSETGSAAAKTKEELMAKAKEVAAEKCKVNPKLKMHEALAAAYKELGMLKPDDGKEPDADDKGKK